MKIADLSTQELNNLIEGIAVQALHGHETKSNDELCELAHQELNRRAKERGERVRTSNLKKNYFGEKAYVCGIEVDGRIIETYFETNLELAKSYRRFKK